jgi:hypothetical protein
MQYLQNLIVHQLPWVPQQQNTSRSCIGAKRNMVQTRAQSAKNQTGLRSLLLKRSRSDAKPFSQPLPLISAAALRVQKVRSAVVEIKGERRLRARRLQEEILGPNRTFSGTITIPTDSAARESDSVRLKVPK